MGELRSRSLDVAGVRTPAIEAGPAGAREAVVFVHGNPGSRLDWVDLAARAGEFARSIAFDMPGFGEAEKPRRFEYTLDGYARFLDAALAELGVGRAHMVAHDFGGPWCWAWASHAPERLASVVIFNTGMLLGRGWHLAARVWRTPLAGELSMLLTRRRLFRRANTLGGRHPVPDELIERMYRHFDSGTRRAVLRLYRATDIPYRSAPGWIETLSALDPPALIVWGDRDPFVGRRAIEQLRAAFPSARVVHLERSGHFPFADDAQATASAVIPFLREVAGR